MRHPWLGRLWTVICLAVAACSPTQDTDAGQTGDVVSMDADAAPDVIDVVMLDTGPSCSTGQVFCDGRCTDTSTDRAHCGTCGNACAAGNVCVAGRCAVSCTAGQVNCGGACVTLATDRAHCGRCGAACPSGTVCSMGTCATTCDDRLATCGGPAPADGGTDAGDAGALAYCADLATDRANCGACGNLCGPGRICVAGACALTCASGQTLCGSICRDLTTDRGHCGACGNACPVGNVCVAGACQASCGTGLTDCGGSCRDVQVDPAHCGRCGNACPEGQTCQAGTCRASCRVGLNNCNNDCVDLSSDPDHCGSCSIVCSTPARARRYCASSTCGFVCQSGYADCDRVTANGCETSLDSNFNCGGCGLLCTRANATAACSMGQCVLGTCSTGYRNCNARPEDGCEVNILTDDRNCGGCRVECSPGQRCMDGSCQASCRNGQQACDGFCYDTRTDPAHCGGCSPCATAPHASAVCASGVCGITCATGYADCNARADDGCEVSLSDPMNCGGCGITCGSGQSCNGGRCQ